MISHVSITGFMVYIRKSQMAYITDLQKRQYPVCSAAKGEAP
jgi:hypothetical protein